MSTTDDVESAVVTEPGTGTGTGIAIAAGSHSSGISLSREVQERLAKIVDSLGSKIGGVKIPKLPGSDMMPSIENISEQLKKLASEDSVIFYSES